MTVEGAGLPTVKFSESSARVREDAGSVTVNVVLSQAASSTVTVPVSIATGTGKATNFLDFSGVPSSLTFSSGEWVKTITINVVDDVFAEGDEDVALSLGTPTGATLDAPSSYTLTIEDNDPDSSPGGMWKLRQPYPAQDGLGAAAFMGTSIVVVGDNGLSMKSDDGGATWARHWMGTDQSFCQVVYGSQLVAVGGGNLVAASADGVTWSRYPLTAAGGAIPNCNDVMWTGSQYVAVGGYFDEGGGVVRPAIFASTDGITWTQRTTSVTGGGLASIAWNGSRFVAVGYGMVLTSTDGITWQNNSSGMSGVALFNVVWAADQGSHSGGDKFFAFDRNAKVYLSSDGTSWSSRSTGSLGITWSVWDGKNVVGVGDGITTAKSGSGTSWSEKASGVSSALWDIAYSSSMGYVAVGDDHTILTSSNGTTWTRRNTGADFSSGLTLDGVAWSGTQFVAVGGDPTRATAALVATSSDGTTWTKRTLSMKGELTGIAWSGSLYAAVGRQGIIVTSSDGVTWTPRSSPAGTLDLHGVIWAANQFVAVGGHETGELFSTGTGGCVVLTSPNGVTWTRQTTPTVPPLQAVAWSGTKYVAVGRAGTSFPKAAILTSTNAVSWQVQSSGIPDGDDLLAIAWSGSQFLATGSNRDVLRSTDGVAWTVGTGVPASPGADGRLTGVCWTGSQFLVTGPYGRMLASSDGKTWTSRGVDTNRTLNGIACSSGTAVAVGDEATIVSSGGGLFGLPLINFALDSSSIDEAAGTADVLVTMDPAPTSQVTVPYELSSAAQALNAAPPLTVTGAPLVFNPGETGKYLRLSFKGSPGHWGSQMFSISLGVPAGGAAKGSRSTHMLQIMDDQTPPSVSDPKGQLLAVGAPLFLSVTATGSAPLKYQWLKNKVAIRGATAPYFYVAKVALAYGGEYACVAKNAAGSATSTAVQVGVAERTDRAVYVAASKDAAGCTVTQAASGNCSLNWYKGADVVATGPSLRIKQPSVDGGTYVCKVQLAGAELQGNRWDVGVAAAAPKLNPVVLPAGAIGSAYAFQVSPAAGSEPVAAWKAVGLPAGLVMDPRTGLIQGYPSVTAADKAVVITAANGVGAVSVSTNLTITGVPASIVGTTAGLVARDAVVNNGLGARIVWSVNANGRFTGSYRVGGAVQPFSGVIMANDASATGSASFVVRDKKVTVSLHYAANAGSGTVAVATMDGTTLGSAPFVTSSVNVNPAAFAGRYNFALRLTGADAGNASVPQGHGYGSATVNGAGAVAFAGRMGDGSVITSASPLDIDGAAVCYASLYAGRGTFMALPKVSLGDGSIVDLATPTWSKGQDHTEAGRRTYAAGWEPVSLKLEGGRYTAPSAGEGVMGLTHVMGAPNSTLTFGQGGLALTPPFPDVDVNLKTGGAIDLIPAALNPRKTTLVVTPATGTLTGTFTMNDVMPNGVPLVRKVTYFGQVARILTMSPEEQGYGWFLLPQLPGGDVTPMPAPASTPVLSGNVVLRPKM